MKLSIRNKLLLAFGVVLVLAAIIGWVGINQASIIYSRSDLMYSDDLLGLKEVALLAEDVLLNHAKVLVHILRTDPAEKSRLEADIAELDQKIESDARAIRASDVDQLQVEEIAQFLQAWADYKQTREALILPASRARKTEEAVNYATGGMGKQAEVIAAVDALMKSKADSAQAANAENAAAFVTSRWLIVGVTLVSVFIGLGVALFLARGIAGGLDRVVLATQKMASGDLAGRVEVHSGDEIETLAGYFNYMADSLGNIVHEIIDNAGRLSSSAAEISAAANQMSAGADSQTQQVVNTSSAMEEMSATIQQVAQNAQATAEAARAAAVRARDGSDKVEEAVIGLDRTNGSLQQLLERSAEIDKLVSLITDIAAQTNILALNAAIEAAGAGQGYQASGARFDVVAEEIRKLASNTAQSTSRIGATVGEIRREIQTAADQMAKTVALAEEAGLSLAAIVDGVDSVNDMMAAISASTAQQARTSEDVADSLQLITQVTQQTAQAARETASTTDDLSNLAQGLRAIVERFKV